MTVLRQCASLLAFGVGGIAAPPVFADDPDGSANGIAFAASYTADVWTTAGGASDNGQAYLDNLDVVLDADLEALFGWPDTRAHFYALYNNGASFGGRYVGDLQGISNIETGVEAARIFEAWVERGLGERGSLLFGLYDLNSEFDSLETSSLFIHSAHGIGTDIAQTGIAGPSIFPVTSLALRLEYRLTKRWLARLAVLDAVPGDADHPSRTAVHLDEDEGALWVGELERRFDSGKLMAGAWRYTSAFTDELQSARRNMPVEDRGNQGFYLRGEWRPDESAPVSVFARMGWAEPRFNVSEWFAGAGVVYAGPWDARPRDRLGLAVAVAEASDAYRRAALLAGGGHAEPREIALELTYEMPVGDRFVLQPDVQYIVNPGLDPASDNTWVVGLHMTVALFEPLN